VVADNRYIAEDGPALIDVDFESLPAVVEQFAALKPGVPLVHPEWGDNVLCYSDVTLSDIGEAFAAALTPFLSHRAAELPITPDRIRAMNTRGRCFRA